MNRSCGEKVASTAAATIILTGFTVMVILPEFTLGTPQGGPDNMFSEAEKYERFMGRWSHQLARVFVKFAGVKDGERVLDVGSGTGSLALAIAAETKRCEVVGIDPSRPYVEFAAQRVADPHVKFQVGDAQKLDFPNASFDRSLSLLVMNFIPDARKAMAEMRRVTRPGGWVAACTWDYSDGMTMLRIFWDTAAELDPAAERHHERNMPLCRKGELAALWKESGLVDVEETGLVIDQNFSSFKDYWEPFLESQGPAGVYTTGLSTEGRQKLQTRLRDKILAGKLDGPFTLRARAWAVRGRVPGGPGRE